MKMIGTFKSMIVTMSSLERTEALIARYRNWLLAIETWEVSDLDTIDVTIPNSTDPNMIHKFPKSEAIRIAREILFDIGKELEK